MDGLQTVTTKLSPKRAAFRTALVAMPFFSINSPSLQIGLLSAVARKHGFETDTYHLNVDLAATVGLEVYEKLCQRGLRMTGEWLFSHAAFGDELRRTSRDYLKAFPDELEWYGALGFDEARLIELREVILPRFIDECLEGNDWGRYDVVGFSSTFQQDVASLALARRIKAAHPGVRIVFGGANMEGTMGAEHARSFPFIDFVVSGEGDDALPALLERIRSGGNPEEITGVVTRASLCHSDNKDPHTEQFTRLDTLPVPDYEEFFDRARKRELSAGCASTWTLPFESSRGCWWGQKHHCTFCGLNGQGMGYRAKTASRVLQELAELSSRHHIVSFSAVDNIMHPRYVDELFGEIADQRFDYRFFYEVKVNLTKDHLAALKKGGVRTLQPGIETMSTALLKLMRKGSSMLQNVRLLKWCVYFGIDVQWNILWGFTGETEADYDNQLRALRLITHLQPPQGCGRVWLERYSPFFSNAEAFGFDKVAPEPSYEYVYPDHVSFHDIAYFFSYEASDTVPDHKHDELLEFHKSWEASWTSDGKHKLSFRRIPSGILVDVNRGPSDRGTHFLASPIAEMYEACSDTAQSPGQILVDLERQGTVPANSIDPKDVGEVLDGLCRSGLMISEGNLYLALALPSNPAA